MCRLPVEDPNNESKAADVGSRGARSPVPEFRRAQTLSAVGAAQIRERHFPEVCEATGVDEAATNTAEQTKARTEASDSDAKLPLKRHAVAADWIDRVGLRDALV